MKPPAVIEAPQLSEAEIVNRWDFATGREERAEKTLAESRLEKGRILLDARKRWPERGPKAKGWGELLRKLRVEERTARNYMELAGYVVSESVSEIPTYAEAGITSVPPGPEPKSAPVAERNIAVMERGEIQQAFTDGKQGAIVSPGPESVDDSAPIINTVEQMIASSRSLLSQAERLDVFARQGTRIAMNDHAAQGVRVGLIAAKTSIEKALRVMGWEN